MTRTAWWDELHSLITRTARINPEHAERHPAYRGRLDRISDLIAVGLEHEWITEEEACKL